MFRAIDKWGAGYLRSLIRRPKQPNGLCHLMFCVVDHFEPYALLPSLPSVPATPEYMPTFEERSGVVRDWVEKYAASVADFVDADGRHPCHTFFCAPDDYEVDREYLGGLSQLCTGRMAEVELHLHHENDTPENLAQKIVSFRDILRQEYGFLGSRRWAAGEAALSNGLMDTADGGGEQSRTSNGLMDTADGGGEQSRTSNGLMDTTDRMAPNFASFATSCSTPAYGFVHGNWALCNSRPDGRHCGVNEELSVLAETGCYADFTYPSAPSPTQPRMVNALYRATDNPRGRGADCGERVRVHPRVGDGEHRTLKTEHRTSNLDRRKEAQDSQNTQASGFRFHPSSLLLVQGPLGLNWNRRKWGILPRLDSAGITHYDPPTADRVDLWVKQHVHVIGRPEWVFVKVHCHGAIPSTSRMILGAAMQSAHAHLAEYYNDGTRWKLHYVTARELANIVLAAEDGKSGNPGAYRDYKIAPPPLLQT